MNATKLLIAFSLLSTFSWIGCFVVYHKSKFHLAKKEFNLKEVTFRTDGYYYSERILNNSDDSTSQILVIKPIIFYDDGYVRKSEFNYGNKRFSSEKEKIDSTEAILVELEKRIEENRFVNLKKNIWDWGMYSQSGDKILIQYYFNHFGSYRLIDLSGNVENETTIIFTKKFGYKQPNVPKVIDEEVYEFFKFKEFHIKPDSTNYIRDNIYKFG